MGKTEVDTLSDKKIAELYRTDKMIGNEAMINKYNNYIYKIMYNFKNPYILSEKEDLHQAGCVGIMEALRKYDANKGEFYNYCYNYVRKEISEYLRSLSGESSEHFERLHRKVINARDEILKENGTVSVDEIMKRTGISRKLVKREMGIVYTKVSYEHLGDRYYI